jgi:5'-methylthioadenosine phosphorylase
MTKSVLGIICGSGIYDLPRLTNAQSKTISSPWGKTSAALLIGEIEGLPSARFPSTKILPAR